MCFSLFIYYSANMFWTFASVGVLCLKISHIRIIILFYVMILFWLKVVSFTLVLMVVVSYYLWKQSSWSIYVILLVDIDCFLIYLLCKSILYLIEHFSWDLNTNCDMFNCIFKNKNHFTSVCNKLCTSSNSNYLCHCARI